MINGLNNHPCPLPGVIEEIERDFFGKDTSQLSGEFESNCANDDCKSCMKRLQANLIEIKFTYKVRRVKNYAFPNREA